MKSRSELVFNGSTRSPRMRHALSESHLSNETFPHCSSRENESAVELLPCALSNTDEQLEDVTCPSLSDSYDDRLMDLLDCYRSPKYLEGATGRVYSSYNPAMPLECDECLSDILNRTYTEICRRFNKLKQEMQAPRANSTPQNVVEYESPNMYQHAPDYFFGPSQSFPAPPREMKITERRPLRRINFSQNNQTQQTNNIATPSRLHGMYNSTPHSPSSSAFKDLADVSMPTYKSGASSGYYSNKSNASERLTAVSPELCESFAPTPQRSVKIENISAPSGLQSGNAIYQPNVSMPSYGQFFHQDATYPSEMLENVSVPVFAPSPHMHACICRRKAQKSPNLSSQRLEDISAPSFEQSFKQISREKQFSEMKRSSPPGCMSNERLEDVSMPFILTPPSQHRQQPTQVQQSPQSEQIENISMPYAPNIETSPRMYFNRNRSYPNERIADVTPPAFESTPKSIIYCPVHGQNRRQHLPRTMLSERLEDVSSPDLASNSVCSPILPNEFLVNESMPSYASPLDCSRKQPINNCQMSFPSEHIENITAPAYENSGSRQRTMPSEWLDQQSMPTCSRSEKFIYKSVSRRHPESNTCEILNDVSPPIFEKSSSPRQIYSQQKPISSGRVENNSASVFQRSLSRIFSRSKNQQSEKTASPSYSAKYNKRQSPIKQRSFPSERLEDVSAPNWDRTWPPQYSTQSGNINNIPMCEKPAECLDDITPPSMNTNCSPQYSTESEYINNISMPSMNPSNERTPVRHWQTPKSLPRSYLEDVSPPFYNKSFTKPITPSQAGLSKERIQNISKSDLERMRRRLLLPRERLEDQSMPSMPASPQGTSTPISNKRKEEKKPCTRVEDISAPTFNTSTVNQSDKSKSPTVGHISALVQCLNDMLVSHFGLTILPQSASNSRQEQLNDVTIPSIPENLESDCLPQEQLQNQSMPTLPTETSTSLNQRTPKCFSSEQLADISMPTLDDCVRCEKRIDCSEKDLTISGVNFDINNKAHRGATLSYMCSTNQRLEDESPPVLVCSPLTKKYEYELTSNCNNESDLLENESPPRFITVSRSTSGAGSNDLETVDKQESKGKSLLNKTKDIFSKLGEDKQTLVSETSKSETTPVVPIPGTIKPMQNLKAFLDTNKTAESNEREKNKEAKENTRLEDISPPNFNSTSISSEHELQNSKEIRPVALPRPGTLRGFENMKTLAELARNKVKEKERKKLESTRIEDISSPTFNSTPYPSLESVQQQRPEDTTRQMQSKPDNFILDAKKRKRMEQSRDEKSKSPKNSNSYYIDNITAPSYPNTPESIPQIRDYETPTSSRKNKYDGKRTPETIPQIRHYETPTSASRERSRTPLQIGTDNYNGPTTSRGWPRKNYQSSTSVSSPKSSSSKYQSSTLVSPSRSTSNRPESVARPKSTQMIRNERTQTANRLIWSEIDARRTRSTSTPREVHAQPVYEYCNSCCQVHYSRSPNYCYIDYSPYQAQTNTPNTCQEIYECCCQMCEQRKRRRSC